MSRARARAAAALLTASVLTAPVLALSGCAFGPDPREASDRASGVFDDLTAELAAIDPAVLRTVEVVPTDPVPCDDGDRMQQALVARGTLSVRAEDGAAGDVVDTLAASLDGGWEPVRSDDAAVRAWANDDGANVTLTDATPVVVVSVFGPCLPASEE